MLRYSIYSLFSQWTGLNRHSVSVFRFTKSFCWRAMFDVKMQNKWKCNLWHLTFFFIKSPIHTKRKLVKVCTVQIKPNLVWSFQSSQSSEFFWVVLVVHLMHSTLRGNISSGPDSRFSQIGNNGNIGIRESKT